MRSLVSFTVSQVWLCLSPEAPIKTGMHGSKVGIQNRGSGELATTAFLQ